jgi:hypothetical protein
MKNEMKKEDRGQRTGFWLKSVMGLRFSCALGAASWIGSGELRARGNVINPILKSEKKLN